MVSLQGLQKLTLLDYPGRVACTVFTGGCNFRCPFCQNGDLLPCGQSSQYTEADLLAFLQSRQGLLDGVCISGGEPLMQEDLPQLVEQIKAMGYLVKLDTNGSFPERLQQLVEQGLVDYVAMDIKSSPSQYGAACGVGALYWPQVQRSVEFCCKIGYPMSFVQRWCGSCTDRRSCGPSGNGSKGRSVIFYRTLKIRSGCCSLVCTVIRRPNWRPCGRWCCPGCLRQSCGVLP